jgi:hypothetical protein
LTVAEVLAAGLELPPAGCACTQEATAILATIAVTMLVINRQEEKKVFICK